jgi:hypothetical protein
MTDREFDQRLRAFYRDEVELAGRVPDQLRESVLAIPDDVMDRAGLLGPRRRVVLLAAAMLTALLVGGAIALGSGLFRLPWLSEDRITTIAFWQSFQTDEVIPVACDQTLPDGLLLSVEPQVERGELDYFRPWLYLYDDGLVLSREGDGRSAPISWSQRHLSPEGVQRILAAVEETGLRDCLGVGTETPPLEVKAKTGGGVVAIGLGSAGLRVVTPAELEAATDLADRLGATLTQTARSPDLGVPRAGWIEPAWQPYAPDRWEILISHFKGDPGVSYQEGPWADLVLPDGSTFLTFGSSVPVPAEVDARRHGGQVAEYRCRVVGRDEVETMTAFLGEPVAMDPATNEGSWQYWDRPRGGEGVAILVSPLPRHEPGCVVRVGLEPRRFEGAPPPDASGGDLIDGLLACDYLPETPLTWYRGDEHADFGGGWAACSYPPGGWVFASRHEFSSAEALLAVETLFGIDGFTTDRIAGRTVYFNACVEGGDGPPVVVLRSCTPAVAISAEPHFVIVVPSVGQAVTGNLRHLAESLIQRLDDRMEPR